MISPVITRLGAYFTAASLFEVCIVPSPGLVSPLDSGAHQDMNLFTFILGTSALAPYFTEFVRLGYEHGHSPLPLLFQKLRFVGVIAERELLNATSGVNTQRGQLFLLGLAAGVAGCCAKRGIEVPSHRFYDAVREMCLGLAKRELASLRQGDTRTSGERIYLRYGYSGIRGESEAGFPTVEHLGYKALEEALELGLSLNDAGVHSLINIMAVLDDTTVLGRAGEEGLGQVKNTCREILMAGSVFTLEGRERIWNAHEAFCRTRLSPGGAADLLALSMALHFVRHGFPAGERLLVPSLLRR